LLESFEDIIHIQLWSPFVLKRVEVGFEDLFPLTENLAVEAALVPASLATTTRLDQDDRRVRPIRLNNCTVTVLGSLSQDANATRAAGMINEIPYPIVSSRGPSACVGCTLNGTITIQDRHVRQMSQI
jgi:hypothetical protein